jgi:hypothetical protein
MAPSDPSAPSRPVQHGVYLAVIPLTMPPVFIAHCTANDFVSQTHSTDEHEAMRAEDLRQHLEEQRQAGSG